MNQPISSPYSDKDLAVMDSIVKRYPRTRSAIMPLLHYLQSIEGYVTETGIETIAQILSLESAEVNAVATFYTQYKRKPVGQYHVGICTNTLCAVMGGDEIYQSVLEHLGIENDGVTDDGTVKVFIVVFADFVFVGRLLFSSFGSPKKAPQELSPLAFFLMID